MTLTKIVNSPGESTAARIDSLLPLGPEKLAKKVLAFESRLQRLKRLYGITESVEPEPEEKDVVTLLAYFHGYLKSQQYYVDDVTFNKLNRPAAEELLRGFKLPLLKEFLDWFWTIARKTDPFWSKKFTAVDKLGSVKKALNSYLTVRDAPQSGRQLYDG